MIRDKVDHTKDEQLAMFVANSHMISHPLNETNDGPIKNTSVKLTTN